jgi:hypothetical protein
MNRALSTVEVRHHPEQISWPTAAAAQPPAQCVPSDIGALAVPQANEINEGAFSGLEPKSGPRLLRW